MIPRYVFDTGALISAERGKERASRFLQLVHAGRARILVPLPVVAEWWRGPSDIREEILAATEIIASVPAAKAAGVALGRMKNVHARLYHRCPGDCDCRACRRRRHHGRSALTRRHRPRISRVSSCFSRVDPRRWKGWLPDDGLRTRSSSLEDCLVGDVRHVSKVANLPDAIVRANRGRMK